MSNQSHLSQASGSPLPTDTVPTDTVPTDTVPTDTVPTDTVQTYTVQTYTLQAVNAAVTNAVDLIKDGLGLGERDEDLLNLVTHAFLGLLSGQARTLTEVLDHSYDPDTARRLPGWWSGWS
jgi:hypothetical protein